MTDQPDGPRFDVTPIADASLLDEQSEVAALDLPQVLNPQSSIDSAMSQIISSMQETASGVITNRAEWGATHSFPTPPPGGQSAFETAAPPIADLESELLRADAAVLADSSSRSGFDTEVRQQPDNREDRGQMEMDNYQPTVIEPAADPEPVTYEPEAEPEPVRYEPEAELEPITYEPAPEPDYTVDMGNYAGPPPPDPVN